MCVGARGGRGVEGSGPSVSDTVGVGSAREDGVSAFWRGSAPFVQRAMLVGMVQVGTFDQGKQIYQDHAGLKRGTCVSLPCHPLRRRQKARKPTSR